MSIRHLLRSAVALIGSSSLASAAIVIVNPSFETSDIGNGAALANGAYSIPGWGGGTTYLVDNNTTQNQWFNQAVPDGQQANSLGGQYMLQKLNDNVTGAVLTSTVGQQFDISFFAGRRKENTNTGTFSVILQAYDGGTFLGNLAQQMYFTGANDGIGTTIDLNLAVGNWSTQLMLNLTVPANPSVGLGKDIYVVFAQNAPYGSGLIGEVAIDNVSVLAVPEPAAALLGGIGLFSLLRRRR